MPSLLSSARNALKKITGKDHEEPDLIPILNYPDDLPLIPETIAKYSGFYLLNPPLPPAPYSVAKESLFSIPKADKLKLVNRNSNVRGFDHAWQSGREWWDYSPEGDGNGFSPENKEFRKLTKEWFEKAITVLQEMCATFNNEEDGVEVIPKEILRSAGYSTLRYLRYNSMLRQEVPPQHQQNNGNGNPGQSRPPAQAAPTTSTVVVAPVVAPNPAAALAPGPPISNTVPPLPNTNPSPANVAPGAPGAPTQPQSQPQTNTNTNSKNNNNNNNNINIKPQQPRKPDPARMPPHTDHGILTLMTATPPSGLFIYDAKDKQYSAPPLDNAVLVIAADLLTHWTLQAQTKYPPDNTRKSKIPPVVLPTVHEVVIPPDGSERISLAVFFRPNIEAVVDPEWRTRNEKGEIIKDGKLTFGKWAAEKGRIGGRRCWVVVKNGRDQYENLINRELWKKEAKVELKKEEVKKEDVKNEEGMEEKLEKLEVSGTASG